MSKLESPVINEACGCREVARAAEVVVPERVQEDALVHADLEPLAQPVRQGHDGHLGVMNHYVFMIFR